jgi:Spx/MgsR family transcriptional regulator
MVRISGNTTGAAGAVPIGASGGLIIIYGISNCDTVKKARAWLDAGRIGYVFHDYKTAGIDAERLRRWCKALGWETLLNRAGTTFRKLPEADQADLDRERAIALMLARPALIRRPVAEGRGILLAGFKPEIYRRHFAG